ncbi:hypothetical protein DENSPDRAFT_931704, partial [Dentipellis sp. KUC8613]
MADNQFSDIWASAIKQYEADMKINIMDASHNFVNITSPDELLGIIDGEQKKFKNYHKQVEKIQGAVKPVLDVIQTIADIAGEAVEAAFPPAKIVFVAVKLLLDAADNVSARYKAIINIFVRMQAFLERCKTYVKSSISHGLQQRLVEILVHLLSIIGMVTKDIKRGYLRHFFHSVLAKDSALEDALQTLSDLTKEEALAALADIHSKVGQTLQKMVDLTETQKDDKCFGWLAAPDPSVNHNAAQDKVKQGQKTGQWIFQNSDFVEWMHSIHSSMWLHGKPGGGKSVLCSTIINMLQDHRFKASCAVAFFYFDFRDPSKQNCHGMLQSLVKQLGYQSSGAFAVLKKLYADHDNGHMQPSRQKLHDALGDILKQLNSAYIVLDALDECLPEDRHDFLLPFLDKIMLGKDYSVHFLATSRSEVDIEDCFKQKKVSHSIDLDRLVHNDIETYLSTVLQTDSIFQHYDAGLKKQIRDSLLCKADGMFLWVSYQIKELKKCASGVALRIVLDNLPKDLEETYKNILQRIDSKEAEIFHMMLSWIAFSEQPLTKSKLAAAVGISYREAHPKFKESLFPDFSNMLRPISSLIIESNERIQFCHFSVKEYLTSGDSQSNPYHINLSVSHTMIAQSCLYFLVSTEDNSDLRMIETYTKKFVLKHIQNAELDPNKNICDYILHLFGEKRQVRIDHTICGYSSWPFRRIKHSPAWCSSAIGKLDML